MALVRAYAAIADDLGPAGYSGTEIAGSSGTCSATVDLREIIRQASGETIDLKAYEADMRHLIDTYIEAREPKKISAFDDMALLEADRQVRNCRCHRPTCRPRSREQGRRRRDHRQQRPQQDHQGAPERPGLLRPDVRSCWRRSSTT